MRFSDFFENWLYGDNGYYSSYRAIGKEGDFFTAVSTSMFFGGSIAKRIIKSIDEGFLSKNTTIIEIGAHHGYLLADIIQFIFTLRPNLLKSLNFAIVEKHKELREKQQKYFKESFNQEIKLKHYSSLDEVSLDEASIIANEIFDAFKCELIYTKDNIRKIAFVEDFKVVWKECEDDYINLICKKYNIEKGEVAIGYEEFAKKISKIKKYEFITFDYGDKYPRNDFSIRVYKNHEVFPFFEEGLNIKELYKNSDITYDVHFNHLIDSFKKADAKLEYFGTQLKALVEFGIIELLEILRNNTDENSYLKELTKAKTLLEPIGMGERFKCAIFRKEN